MKRKTVIVHLAAKIDYFPQKVGLVYFFGSSSGCSDKFIFKCTTDRMTC
jgi:hypothetical protein